MDNLLGLTDGFEDYGIYDTPLLGFDYSSLLKGAGGLLSGISEGFGGGQKPADASAAQAEAQRRAEAAEKSASTLKWVLVGVGGLVAVGGVVLLATRGGASK